jgi:tetratricopeptide (TPR) repeat protein
MRMGRYQEALKGYSDALDIRVHHLYYYHIAVVMERLGEMDFAERSLLQAIDSASLSRDRHDRHEAKKYKQLWEKVRKRNKQIVWFEWWFNDGGILRKIIGGALLAIVFVLLEQLFNDLMGNHLKFLVLINTRSLSTHWTWFITALIVLGLILLSPIIRKIGTQTVEFDAFMAERDIIHLPIFSKHLGKISKPRRDHINWPLDDVSF